MPKWIQNSFVIFVTVLTFGLITPSQIYEIIDEKPPKKDSFLVGNAEQSATVTSLHYEEPIITERTQLENLLVEVEQASYDKFGKRIKPVIENEFRTIILPQMENAIKDVAMMNNGTQFEQLIITEVPTGGNSEKIFHIGDKEYKKDLIRFHVRRDHPPQSGYWFNFHYHTYLDDFERHHELGAIYWNNNTPPKWMS